MGSLRSPVAPQDAGAGDGQAGPARQKLNSDSQHVCRGHWSITRPRTGKELHRARLEDAVRWRAGRRGPPVLAWGRAEPAAADRHASLQPLTAGVQSADDSV